MKQKTLTFGGLGLTLLLLGETSSVAFNLGRRYQRRLCKIRPRYLQKVPVRRKKIYPMKGQKKP